MIILINQQASAFGTVSGQFFASPPKKFTGPIKAMRHPHFHDRASLEAAWQAVVKVSGSDFLMDGGVTGANWFGELAPK